MNITPADGFNFWLGTELYPFLIGVSLLALVYGLAYLFLNLIPTMKRKARDKRRLREASARRHAEAQKESNK